MLTKVCRNAHVGLFIRGIAKSWRHLAKSWSCLNPLNINNLMIEKWYKPKWGVRHPLNPLKTKPTNPNP